MWFLDDYIKADETAFCECATPKMTQQMDMAFVGNFSYSNSFIDFEKIVIKNLEFWKVR